MVVLDLGNALFELAATIGIAMDRGEPAMFPASWMHRPYFSVPDAMFGDVPDDAVEATEYAQHLHVWAQPYLQDLNLFWPYIDTIRKFLQPSPLALETLAQYELPLQPRMAIHVRRGDNVIDPGVPNKEEYHLCPDKEYYRRGGQLFIEEAHSVSVFSDDIEWCKQNIPANFYGDSRPYWKEHEPLFGHEAPFDWIDLFLMSECDYFVLSGSTFGTWAALLSNAEPDHVVRPNKVYGPRLSYIDENLMFRPEWRTLHAARLQ